MNAALRLEADYGDEDRLASAVADLEAAEMRLHSAEMAWEEARGRVRLGEPGAEADAEQCRLAQRAALSVWSNTLSLFRRVNQS